MRKGLLKAKVKGYFTEGELRMDSSFTLLVPYYLDKARHNLETASILLQLSENVELKKKAKIREDYYGYDWVISAGYYAMFHAVTAALGAIGIRAETHESLIEGLEYHFVYKEKIMENEDIKRLNEAKRLEEKYINRMWATKSRRVTAQYKAEKTIAKKDAEKTYSNAIEFVDRLSKLISEITSK
ncbi:MAG: HEPN domain-containing protein [Candidatus Omnitrophica bacterium]|nr:HEPN domain-containing protein [Candidatus Omnitrophota bacterium]